MAINFEAANMAGYNNPKIEVFKVVVDSNDTIISAPSKTEIIRCITRGSIPAILVTYSPEMTEAHMLYINYWFQEAGGNTINFSNGASLAITYSHDSEQPVLSTNV